MCRHCGSPISILDPAQTARTIAQLQHEAGARPLDVDVAGESHDDGFDVLVRLMKADPGSESGRGMVNVGLRFMSDLLKNRSGQ